MAIKRIEIKDFLLFKGEFAADFCPGVNVFIGANATGKTTLLRILYGFCQGFSNGFSDSDNIAHTVFGSSGGVDADELINKIDAFRKETKEELEEKRKIISEGEWEVDEYEIEELESALENLEEDVSIWKDSIRYSFMKLFFGSSRPNKSGHVDWFRSSDSQAEVSILLQLENNQTYSHARIVCDNFEDLSLHPTFIPVRDALSISKITQINDKYRKSLDIDPIIPEIILQARWLVPDEIPAKAKTALEKLSNEIDGEMLVKNDGTFWIKKKNGKLISFNAEAEGYKKLGLLWQLLRNDSISNVLFWDEPENSLNPELFCVLADILLELARSGVQIFIASHEYYFARYFDVREKKDIPVLFHSLTKNETGQIEHESSPKYIKLENNHLENAAENLYEAVISDGMGMRSNG